MFDDLSGGVDSGIEMKNGKVEYMKMVVGYKGYTFVELMN